MLDDTLKDIEKLMREDSIKFSHIVNRALLNEILRTKSANIGGDDEYLHSLEEAQQKVDGNDIIVIRRDTDFFKSSINHTYHHMKFYGLMGEVHRIYKDFNDEDLFENQFAAAKEEVSRYLMEACNFTQKDVNDLIDASSESGVVDARDIIKASRRKVRFRDRASTSAKPHESWSERLMQRLEDIILGGIQLLQYAAFVAMGWFGYALYMQ